MVEDPIEDPIIRDVATTVMRSSASEPNSERFRLQLEQEFRNAGVSLTPDELAAVQRAVVEGRV